MKLPLHHLLPEIENPAVHHEGAIAIVVDRPTFFTTLIHPCLDGFEDEEIVLTNHAGICHLAFDIGETFGHERRRDLFGGHRRQAEP